MVKKWLPFWVIQKHMVGDTIASGTSTQTHGLMHHVFGTPWPDAPWSRAFGVTFKLGRSGAKSAVDAQTYKKHGFRDPSPIQTHNTQI